MYVFWSRFPGRVWDFFSQTPSIGFNRRLAQELGLSMLWVAYALAQIVPGFAWKSVALRWQGLTLMGVAIVKVFFFDLSFLSSFYRIVSFFALGLVLLGVSFFYQKMARSGGAENVRSQVNRRAARAWAAMGRFWSSPRRLPQLRFPARGAIGATGGRSKCRPPIRCGWPGLVPPGSSSLRAQTSALPDMRIIDDTWQSEVPYARYAREGSASTLADPADGDSRGTAFAPGD